MTEVTSFIYDFISNCLSGLGVYAPILACFLIMIESILPILPLFVFITINFIAFGNILGFIISWICTIFGCMISFFLVRRMSQKRINIFLDKHEKIKKIMNNIENLSLSQVSVILAIPFTPAFAVNIAAGLTRMRARKYLISLAIGKIFLVYFWGFIGTSLLESLKNPLVIIKVIIMLIIALIVSKIISKIFKIN